MKKILFYLLAIIMMVMAMSQAKAQSPCPDGYAYVEFTYTDPISNCIFTISYCWQLRSDGPVYDVISENITFPIGCADYAYNVMNNLANIILTDFAGRVYIPPCDETFITCYYKTAQCWKKGIRLYPNPVCYYTFCNFDGYCVYDYEICVIPNTTPPQYQITQYWSERQIGPDCPLMREPPWPDNPYQAVDLYGNWESECYNGGCTSQP